jgi:hypothetical protein
MRSKDSPYATGFLSANINFDFNDSRNFKERKKEEKEINEDLKTRTGAGLYMPKV